MGAFEPLPESCDSGATGGIDTGRRDGESTLSHQFSVAFGRDNRDNRPTGERVTATQLVNRWRVPDTHRGMLSSADFHALDEKSPEQKKLRSQEKNGEYFAVAEFGGDGSRLDENILSLGAFVLDFDSGRTSRQIIEERLAGLTYIAYTTYSHLARSPRWRVLVPYRQPIRPDQHFRVYDHFQRLFGGDLDESCRKPCQIYYTPACPRDAVDQYEMFCQDRTLFDPEELQTGPDANQPDSEEDPASASGATPTEELARIKEALAFLDPDPRALWIRIGLAIKHDLGDGGMAIWLEWSQRSPKFSMADAVKQWQSLKPKRGDGAVTLRTVYYLAREVGWEPDASEGVPTEIAALNEEYFIAPYGGKVVVFREVIDPVDGQPRLETYSRADFQLLFANRTVLIEGEDGKTSEVALGKFWLEHRARRQYAGVVFAPKHEVPGYYNLWQGFAVKAQKGSWRLFRWHLLFVICRGDRRCYRYLLGWMAYAIQHPDRPAEVAVVLRGGRGAGKGLFARSFGKLFGPHYLQITQARHLTGNFNKHLESCVLLFVDEAFWAGDKQGEGVLKGLVTEPTLAVERKFFDVVTARNCLHMMVASNSEWVVPAGTDERRFFVLEVDDSRKQDPDYFGPVYAEMNEDGLAAMLYDLQQRDLSRFDIRQVPQNKALGEQKMQSLDPFSKWWFGKLVNGEFSDPRVFGERFPLGRVPTETVYEDYVRALGKTGVSRKAMETELGINLPKWLPPGVRLRVRVSVDRRQVPHYDFPPLDVCRTYFEERMKLVGRIDWDEGGIIRKTT